MRRVVLTPAYCFVLAVFLTTTSLTYIPTRCSRLCYCSKAGYTTCCLFQGESRDFDPLKMADVMIMYGIKHYYNMVQDISILPNLVG